MAKFNSSEFTYENFMSYAKACRLIAEDMTLFDFDTLLIPSRGAVPIFLGSLHALKYLGKEKREYKTLAERMTAPLSIRQGILPRAKERETDENDIEILPYPLTADVNIAKYEPSSDNTYYSALIREFSVKVLKNFFKKPYERMDDPYFKFFSEILTKIEKREKLALEYLTYPQVKNLAMIDTIISGRAVKTILNAFGEEDIHPQSLLVVDRNGEKMEKGYAQQLGYKQPNREANHFLFEKRFGRTVMKELKIDRRKNEFYDVNRIMTEDTGCALQGVSATVYPTLIVEGHRKLFPDKNKGLEGLSEVGAGTWYALPREKKHKRIFYSFINTLKSAINLECAKEEFHEREESIVKKEGLFKYKREKLVELLDKTELPDVNIENINQYYPEYDKTLLKDVYETSSQVLHIVFTKEFTDYFIDTFKEGLENNAKKTERLEKLL